jgi:biopolymer transport protein ExbD
MCDFLIANQLERNKYVMLRRSKTGPVELPTSSTADIAFLLLSFFLMTTVIEDDKGLPLVLPEWRSTPVFANMNERNVFKIHINSNDQLMVEGEILSSEADIKSLVKKFVLNNGADAKLSEDPEKAVVSLKADRGTTHKAFIAVLDEIQGAYYEIYAARAGRTVEAYRSLDPMVALERQIIERAKDGIPMNISIAEPSALAVK